MSSGKERSISRKAANRLSRKIMVGLIQGYLDIGAAHKEFGDDEESALKLNDAMQKWLDYFDRVSGE